MSGQAQEYYDIQLMDGGTILVPVNKAGRVGLRLLSNGVDAVTSCLQSPAQSLPMIPDNGRLVCGHAVRLANRQRWLLRFAIW